MQLSPRQYQVDPTGSSYVADTRPLMAAMGAQAATQIEGNRMMQETVQRGMKGVEDFAARRQLAAARAQLGELNINDPDYGQKLSGLVMDNPLAFTNEKTAGVANFAFKQAATDFQSKRENEQRMALQAAEFNLRRDMANMSRQDQMSLSDQSRADQVNALIFGKQDASLQNEEESLRAQRLLIADPKGQALIDKKLGAIANRRNSLAEQLRQGSVVQKQSYGVAPFPDDAYPAPTDLGNGAVYGEGNLGPEFMPEEGQTFGDAAQSDGLNGALFPAPNAPIIQGTNAPAATPVFDPNFTPEPAPQVETPLASQIPFSPQFQMQAPAAPAAPAAQVTSSGLTLEEEKELNSILSQTAAAKAKKKEDGMSSSDYQNEEKFTDDLSYSDPDIVKVSSELDALKSSEEALKLVIDKSKVGATADQEAQYSAAVLERSLKQSQLDKAKANFRTAVRLAGGPDKFLAFRIEQEKAAREEALKAQGNAPVAPAAAVAPAAPAAGAGGTPPPPPPPMGLLEQAEFDRLKPIKEQEKIAAPESNKQWTDAKNQVIDIVGGPQELMSLAQIAYRGEIPGISDLTRKQVLFDLISKRFYADKEKAATLKVFRQKAERLGPQEVTPVAVIAALVDDVLNAQIVANKRANAAVATPAPFIPPVTGAKGTSIPQ